jgi:hypothetical protein
VRAREPAAGARGGCGHADPGGRAQHGVTAIKLGVTSPPGGAVRGAAANAGEDEHVCVPVEHPEPHTAERGGDGAHVGDPERVEFGSTHGAFLGADIEDKERIKGRVLESMLIQARFMGYGKPPVHEGEAVKPGVCRAARTVAA